MSTTAPVSPSTPHDDDGEDGVGAVEEAEEEEEEEEDDDDEDDDDFEVDNVEVDLERPSAVGLVLAPLILVLLFFSLAFNASTCLALNCVNTRMGLCPAF